jgi:Domain of unknown function (DUF4424)
MHPQQRTALGAAKVPRGVAALALFGLATLGAVTSTQANDSSAHLATGGLILSRSDAVEIASEDLFISTAVVRVRYHFLNTTDHEVTTLVAFPLPDITAPSDATNFVIPVDDPVNFLGFATTVDGKPIKMQVEQKAIALGIDRTAMLEKLGIPIAPHVPGAAAALEKLPAPAQAELQDLGLITFEEYDEGKGMERHARPLWSLKTTYYWEQVFPAKAQLIVEHQYKPSVGASVQSMVGASFADADTMADYKRRYCMDADFVKAATALQKSGKVRLAEARLEYILSTGANWAGPIKDFRLVIDKGSPENLVSFCAEGVKKISPTQFEVHHTDYWPTHNLEVLILEPHAQNQ